MEGGEIQRLQEQQYGYDQLADASDSQISDDEMSQLLGQSDSGDTTQDGGQKLMAEDLASVAGARDLDAFEP